MIRRAKRVTFRMSAAEEDLFDELRGYRGRWTDTNIVLGALVHVHTEMMAEKLAQEQEEKAASDNSTSKRQTKNPTTKKGIPKCKTTRKKPARKNG